MPRWNLVSFHGSQGPVPQKMALRPVDGAFAPRGPRARRGPSDSHLDA